MDLHYRAGEVSEVLSIREVSLQGYELETHPNTNIPIRSTCHAIILHNTRYRQLVDRADVVFSSAF
jgi:hypothetical protein